MQPVYQAAGGSEGPLLLARAWHARAMADELVSHPFSDGFHPEHSERLAAYRAEALGGPTTSPIPMVRPRWCRSTAETEREQMDRRAIARFDQALTDVALSEGNPVQTRVLHDYFAWATTTTISRYHQSAVPVLVSRTNGSLVGCVVIAAPWVARRVRASLRACLGRAVGPTWWPH